MKGTVCSLLFFVSFCFLSAQDYHPLLEEGKTWNVFYWDNTCFVNPCGGAQYSLGEDTIINEIVYKKIIQRSIVSDPPVFYPPFTLSKDSSIISFMREDIVNRKVYARGSDSYEKNEEYLAYDFDLQLKDSLVLPYLDSTFVVLDTIKTIILSNGEYRKIYLFENNDYLLSDAPSYVEGIGGDSGLFFPFLNTIESDITLGCVRRNEINLYENPSYRWGCETITIAKNIKVQYKLSIFPNPASEVLNISCKDCKLRNVEIIDVNGSLALKKQLYQIDHQQIDINYLSSGIYFIRLYDENGNYITTKFIK